MQGVGISPVFTLYNKCTYFFNSQGFYQVGLAAKSTILCANKHDHQLEYQCINCSTCNSIHCEVDDYNYNCNVDRAGSVPWSYNGVQPVAEKVTESRRVLDELGNST